MLTGLSDEALPCRSLVSPRLDISPSALYSYCAVHILSDLSSATFIRDIAHLAFMVILGEAWKE